MNKRYYDDLIKAGHNPNLEKGMEKSIIAYHTRKQEVLKQFPHMVQLADEVRKIKEYAVAHQEELVAQASQNFNNNGAQVHQAQTDEEACEIIGNIVGSGKIVVSAKTLTGEEISIRDYLERMHNEVWETDIGQLIQQLRHEKPMHYVFPSLHVSSSEVAALLTNLIKKPVPDSIETEVAICRQFLRDKFTAAHFGLTGSNVVAADTGALFLIESEGNIRMSSAIPDVHIALVGIEKIVPTLSDAFKVATTIFRYAGFTIPKYLSIISGPSSTADIENTLVEGSSGPKELHVIFLDNGRKTLAKEPILKESLYCIKCGSCLFECPVFHAAAGYFGGKGYFGGNGSILNAYLIKSLDSAAFTNTCLRCGRCNDVCPVSIDVPKLITELRSLINQ